MPQTFVTKGRHFKFKLPDEGVRIEAGHVAQVPLVVEGVLGSAQTGDLIRCLDGNTVNQDVVFSVNQDGQLEVGARFSVSANFDANTVDTFIWICPVGRTARVLAINEIHSVIGGAGAVFGPNRTQGTDTPSQGNLLTTANIGLETTVNTVNNATLTATDALRVLAAGDRLSLNFNGTLTGVVGCVSFDMVFES